MRTDGENHCLSLPPKFGNLPSAAAQRGPPCLLLTSDMRNTVLQDQWGAYLLTLVALYATIGNLLRYVAALSPLRAMYSLGLWRRHCSGGGDYDDAGWWRRSELLSPAFETVVVVLVVLMVMMTMMVMMMMMTMMMLPVMLLMMLLLMKMMMMMMMLLVLLLLLTMMMLTALVMEMRLESRRKQRRL